MNVAELLLKQAAQWFDSSSDEEVLRVLGPGLLNLMSRMNLPAVRRHRAIRLLQQGLDYARERSAEG